MPLLIAILTGRPYPPPGVEGTPENRDLWDKISAGVEAMPAGVIPDVPAGL